MPRSKIETDWLKQLASMWREEDPVGSNISSGQIEIATLALIAIVERLDELVEQGHVKLRSNIISQGKST